MTSHKAVRSTERGTSPVEKKGGQVLMGPQQPRPKTQTQVPAPPPRSK